MRLLLLLLPLAAAAAAAAAPLVDETRVLAPFVSLSICAPLSVRVRATPPGAPHPYYARLRGERTMLDALVLTQARAAVAGVAVELMRPVATDNLVEIDLFAPPRVFQYAERVLAGGDTVVSVPFSPDKCEIAASGGGNWWVVSNGAAAKDGAAVGVGLAKVSLGAPGSFYANAPSPYWEVFASDAGAAARVDGANGTVSARLDAGSATVNPSTQDVSIGGYVIAGRLSYSRGTCSVRDEGGGKGAACAKVAPPSGPPDPPPLRWACGFETTGEWACGGGGRGGAPSVRETACRAGAGERDMMRI
jgi:hypothetical protein